MSTKTPPSPEKVLRTLFWQLLFRGRSAPHMNQHRKRKQISLTGTILIYALFGLMPAMGIFAMPQLAFASLLHSFTFLFASLTLASSAGTMLFMREEAEILLHRPIRPQELLRAKCHVLVKFSLILAFALNFAGFFTGTFAKNGSLLFLPAHALATVLLMVFSAALIVLVYNLCLKWFGRERFENLLTLVQTVLTMRDVRRQPAAAAASCAWTRSSTSTSRMAGCGGPAAGLVWRARRACCAASVDSRTKPGWPPALGDRRHRDCWSWLAFVRLGSAYGIGLHGAEREAPAPLRDRPRSAPARADWSHAAPAALVAARSRSSGRSFLLTSAYLLARSRDEAEALPGRWRRW
jgi:hypothetical protein